MPPLSDSRRGWFSNKLKGDFAENICNTHLSTLDYDVEKVGIENIAPKYAMNMSSFQTNFVVSQLNKTPDFVVSKRNDTAIFVEVKYNSTIDNSDQAFYDYGTALMIRYKELIFRNEIHNSITENITSQELKNLILNNNNIFNDSNVYFYVLVPHRNYYNSYVFLFIPKKIDQRQWGWRGAANTSIDDFSGIPDFHLRYDELIKPFLDTIFNSN